MISTIIFIQILSINPHYANFGDIKKYLSEIYVLKCCSRINKILNFTWIMQIKYSLAKRLIGITAKIAEINFEG